MFDYELIYLINIYFVFLSYHVNYRLSAIVIIIIIITVIQDFTVRITQVKLLRHSK